MPVSGLSYVTITGTYLRGDGSYAEGLIEFRRDVQLVDVTSNQIVPEETVSARLVNSAFSVSLPATDDATFAPVDYTYQVREIVDDTVRQFSILLPTSPSTIDIADVTVVDSSGGDGGGGGGASVSDAVYGAAWNGVTDIAPSKNTVYDKIESLALSAGAPTNADYLVGTANAGLSNEIVVGATPGGELGGSWASPTVDAVHSGSSHAETLTAANAYTDDEIAALVLDAVPVYYDALASEFAGFQQAVLPVPTMIGSFTPTSTKVQVSLSMHGWNLGVGHVTFYLAYSQSDTSPLQVRTRLLPLKSNTTIRTFGATPLGTTGSIGSRILLTGLTPNVAVNYELMVAPGGYTTSFATGVSPYRAAITIPDWVNGRERIFVTCNGDATVHVMDVPDDIGQRAIGYSSQDSARGIITTPVGTNPIGIAVTPGDNKAIVCNFTSNTVGVFGTRGPFSATGGPAPLIYDSTHTSGVGGAAISTGAGKGPWQVVCSADNLYAYIIYFTANQVVALNLTTYVLGTPVTLTGLTGGPIDIAINPSGTHLYIIGSAATGKILPVAISGGGATLTVGTAITSSPNDLLSDIECESSTALWVTYIGSEKVQRYTISGGGGTLTASFAYDCTLGGTRATPIGPTGLMFGPDDTLAGVAQNRRLGWVGFNAGRGHGYFWLADGVEFDGAKNDVFFNVIPTTEMRAAVVDRRGGAWFIDVGGQRLVAFTGSQCLITPGFDYTPDLLELVIDGAS